METETEAQLEQRRQWEGMLFGLVGVMAFSLTLPAMRVAVRSLDPVVVGLGRTLLAACFAGPLLWITKQPIPKKREIIGLLGVVLGVTVGFPVLTSWAMQRVHASHGAVVIGLMPLLTASFSVLRTREYASPLFWCASVGGSATVVGYALANGDGAFQMADLALLGAVVVGAIGYTEGGWLAKSMGGWQVICWALVLSLPFIVVPIAYIVCKDGVSAHPSEWACFLYISLISGFTAFFAWFRGLAIGGIARVSQLQLLQPFLTLIFASAFLGESLSFSAIGCAIVVASSILIGKLGKPASVTNGS